MIPKRQTELHDPSTGAIGNCFSACLASLLEIEVDQVPHFTEQHPNDTLLWRGAINAWLRPRGLVYVEFYLGEDLAQWQPMLSDLGWHILSGPSPRSADASHACIARAGTVEWDPHPTVAGLAPGFRIVGLLVRLAGA